VVVPEPRRWTSVDPGRDSGVDRCARVTGPGGAASSRRWRASTSPPGYGTDAGDDEEVRRRARDAAVTARRSASVSPIDRDNGDRSASATRNTVMPASAVSHNVVGVARSDAGATALRVAGPSPTPARRRDGSRRDACDRRQDGDAGELVLGIHLNEMSTAGYPRRIGTTRGPSARERRFAVRPRVPRTICNGNGRLVEQRGVGGGSSGVVIGDVRGGSPSPPLNGATTHSRHLGRWREQVLDRAVGARGRYRWTISTSMVSGVIWSRPTVLWRTGRLGLPGVTTRR
jgi:hypothetical protein